MAVYLNDKRYKNNVEFLTSAAIKHVAWNDADGSALQIGDSINLGILPSDTIVNNILVVVDEAFVGTLPAFDIVATNQDGSVAGTVTGIVCSAAGIIVVGNIATANVFNPDGTAFVGEQPIIWNKLDNVHYSITWAGGTAPTAGALRIIFNYYHLEQTDEGFGLAYQPLNIYTGV